MPISTTQFHSHSVKPWIIKCKGKIAPVSEHAVTGKML